MANVIMKNLRPMIYMLILQEFVNLARGSASDCEVKPNGQFSWECEENIEQSRIFRYKWQR